MFTLTKHKIRTKQENWRKTGQWQKEQSRQQSHWRCCSCNIGVRRRQRDVKLRCTALDCTSHVLIGRSLLQGHAHTSALFTRKLQPTFRWTLRDHHQEGQQGGSHSGPTVALSWSKQRSPGGGEIVCEILYLEVWTLGIIGRVQLQRWDALLPTFFWETVYAILALLNCEWELHEARPWPMQGEKMGSKSNDVFILMIFLFLQKEVCWNCELQLQMLHCEELVQEQSRWKVSRN
jgi:hypothetical protein